jgi:hypothetical protein
MTPNEYDVLVFNRLSDTGLPTARGMWGPHPPIPPRLTYLSRPTYAHGDNTTMASMPHYDVTLHMQEWDGDLVDQVEAVIADMGTYSRDDGFDQASELFACTWHLFLVNREVA